MDIDIFQQDIVATIEKYGRPSTMADHLEKLGEEVGELACAVAKADSLSFAMMQNVADECCDVINVVMSLMEKAGFRAEHRLIHKHEVLKDRIRKKKFDRKWGSKL